MSITREDCEKCRAYGHAWEPAAPHPAFDKLWDKALHSVCIRCESTKVDDLDFDGRPYRTIYYHSNQYARFILDRDDRPSRGECRNLILDRNRKKNRRLKAVS